ncbi:MAG: 30S ribosomal protein S6 [Patescibacteria group bacterium]
MAEEEAKVESAPTVYEVGYLAAPDLTDEEVARVYAGLKDAVSGAGAEVISDELPKKIPLAYNMEKILGNTRRKFNSAYFGWVKFALPTDKISEVKQKFTDTTEVIRFLVVKTTRESATSGRRFMRDIPYRKPLVTRRKEEAKPAAPINKEEIDKEIEAMVSAE